MTTDNENWSMHSGWLVGDFLGERGTAIIPHYWVVNADREHFDVTPKNPSDTQSYEYVSDFNIVQYFTKEVQLPVPLKLNLNGTFVARRKDGSFELIEKINNEGMAIFMVEQNANMALSIADRGWVLQTGMVVLNDSAEALLANPEMRAAYLGEA